MKDSIDRFYRRLGLPIEFWSRWVLGLAILPLLASFAFPLWNIHMHAPQYPNGLQLDIYAHTIEGGNQGNDLNEINTLKLRRDPNCPICGDHPTIKQLIDYEEFCSLRH